MNTMTSASSADYVNWKESVDCEGRTKVAKVKGVRTSVAKEWRIASLETIQVTGTAEAAIGGGGGAGVRRQVPVSPRDSAVKIVGG